MGAIMARGMVNDLAYVLLAIGLFAALLLLLEVGRWAGRREAVDPDRPPAGVGVVQAALFALLGLLIAFSFSGAASRLDWRRQLIVEEANAIRTAYLRLDLLPAQARPTLRAKFREYLQTRLAVHQTPPDSTASRQALVRTNAIEDEIWGLALAGSEPASRFLILPTLNAMFEVATRRTASMRTHPPLIIFVMLVGCALISAVLVGHAMAPGATRSWTHSLAFAVMIALAVYVILDLEHPRTGLIRIDAFDQVLVDLAEKIR